MSDEVAERRWRALGTSVVVLVTAGRALEDAAAAVAAVLDRVDAACSRFRADSEISRLNARSGERVRLSPLLASALDAGVRAGRLSGGAVDLTVGEAIRRAGYDADFARLPDDAGPVTHAARPVPGWHVVDLDMGTATVRVPRGVELDVGSVGKALAADLAAEAAAAPGAGVLVSLGGDIRVAGTPPEGGWRILAADDSGAAAGSAGETIGVADGGVATSSTTVRRWLRGGCAFHHLIDPATGFPAVTPWRTVTVCAATCVDANIAATASVIRGDGAPAWLRSLGLPARLVDNHGGVLRVAGWPAPAAAAT